MAHAISSPLLKLFGVDSTGPGHSLQHIRDMIYSYIWSRVRRDDHKLDFVISETGINRNVPERLISGKNPYSVARAPRIPPPPCNLHLVNKQFSKDFARYIYSANDLEVDVDLKPLHTTKGQAALDKITTLLCNPNFQRHTRTVRIRIHFPADYSAASLPDFNQSALDNIALALDNFQHLGHLAIRIVPGQGEPLDYELRLAAFPFYPMKMTNWSIRILNAGKFPYTWDLIDARSIVLLNQAYEIYQQTGSLTGPVQPAHKEVSVSAGLEQKGMGQSSSRFRQPTNGSQKRRGRKKRAAETAEAVLEAAADAAADATKQSASTTTMSNVQSPGSEATTTQLIETNSGKESLDPKADHLYSTAGKSAAQEQPLDPRGTLDQISRLEYKRPTSAPSPPPSPDQNKEVANVPGFNGFTVHSPTHLSDSGPANETPTSDQTEDGARQNSGPLSPARSSVTLVPLNDDLTVEHVDNSIDAADGEGVKIAQSQQIKKKRRSKKAKKNKIQTKIAQSVNQQHEAGSGQIVEFEIDIDLTDQEHSEHSNDLAARHYREASDELSSSGPSRFNMSQGAWSPLGDYHAVYTPGTGVATIFSRTPRIERYLRQQERLLAAKAEIEERHGQAKAKNQTRKARQLLLRRDHITANSPLLRAMERPRSNLKKQVSPQPQSRSASLSLDEELARNQAQYDQMEDERQRIQAKMHEYEKAIEKQHGRQRIAELQGDDEKRDLKDQLHTEYSRQDHSFEFDVGSGAHDEDNDDHDSVDSFAQERPESIAAEKPGEMTDETSWTEKVNRHIRPHGLSIRFQKEDPEPYRFEALSPQTSERGHHSAEGSQPQISLALDGENAIPPQAELPNSPEPVPRSETNDKNLNSDAAMAHIPGLEISFLEGCSRHDFYPEFGPGRPAPAYQLFDIDNEFTSPVVPSSLRMPSDRLLSAGAQNENLPNLGHDHVRRNPTISPRLKQAENSQAENSRATAVQRSDRESSAHRVE